jgi:hypothetical protein
MISPVVGCLRPEIVFKIVLFPAPLAPMSVTIFLLYSKASFTA